MTTGDHSRQASIEAILTQLVDEGMFECAVVASKDGLLLATVGSPNSILIAAIAAAMKDLAERAHEGLTEIVTRDAQGNQVVSRYFTVGKDLLLLAIQVPARRVYRRLMQQAVKKVQQIWSA